jgi:hypothetical protein
MELIMLPFGKNGTESVPKNMEYSCSGTVECPNTSMPEGS